MNTTLGNSTLSDSKAPVSAAAAVQFILVDGLTMFSNIVIGVLVIKDKQHLTNVGKLHLNQTLADFCIALSKWICIIYEVTFQPDSSTISTRVTNLRLMLTFFYSGSLQSIGALAVFLCFAICHPIKYRTSNKSLLIWSFIIISWAVNAIVAMLYAAASDEYVHSDLMLFSFYRLSPRHIWYEVIKVTTVFSCPLLGYLSIIRIGVYRWSLRGMDAAIQSETRAMVRQATGVLVLFTTFITAFIANIIVENIWPVSVEDEQAVGAEIVNLYFVMKLPLFLASFKSYRKVARKMFCPCCKIAGENRVGVSDINTSVGESHRDIVPVPVE